VLAGSILEELRQQSGERLRLVFASGGGTLPLVVSLHPELPWIGRPALRWDGPVWSPEAFVNTASRSLIGRRIDSVLKEGADRSLRLDFGPHAGLAIELATHGANVVLLGEGGRVEAAMRHPKRSAPRLTPGAIWQSRPVPEGKLDPFQSSPDEIDTFLAARVRTGEAVFEALRRDVVGIGSIGAELVLAEAHARGLSAGTVLRERLDSLPSATVVIEGPEDPETAARRGRIDRELYRLLPWSPAERPADRHWHDAGGAIATAGLFHDAIEAQARTMARLAALRSILKSEAKRAHTAHLKVQEALSSFADPDRFTRLGEALLAGLRSARRREDEVLVPDPYDPEGREIAVPAGRDRPLTQAADDLFQKGRRARRGRELATARGEALRARSSKLEVLAAMGERARGTEGVESLEAAMRAEKIPVGLMRGTKASRAAARTLPPKLEGIRMLESVDGWSILIGRTGRDNDRLTFKISAPEDIWLHAAGVPGAHVIIRTERDARVPDATLAQAARAAAWFSDARHEAAVDVSWTRRKNVRRAKGASSGQVVLKRFETIRVRPTPPEGLDG
jgi:predicted ribosome quality control (RQC) complex YloA/Tae2 family protein